MPPFMSGIYYFLSKDFITQSVATNHHSRNVERTLEDITLRRLCHGTVTMQVTIPFRIFLIWEVCVSPVANLLMHFQVLFITGCLICIESRNMVSHCGHQNFMS